MAKNWQEDNDRYTDGFDNGHGRPKRTKFRSLDDQLDADFSRDKRSGKRSHRQMTFKDAYWAEHDR